MLQVGVAALDEVTASRQGGPPLAPIDSGKFLPVRADSLRNAILVETNAVLTFLPVKTR